jgi:hypothetical protein
VLLLLVGVLGRRRLARSDRYREMSEFS